MKVGYNGSQTLAISFLVYIFLQDAVDSSPGVIWPIVSLFDLLLAILPFAPSILFFYITVTSFNVAKISDLPPFFYLVDISVFDRGYILPH